jgi:hypothetical protein
VPRVSLVRAARAFRCVDSLPKIGGGLNETTALAIIEALWLQERAGFTGDLAEIGVFQGKSFVALAAGARAGERLFAVNIYDMPDLEAERPEYDVTAYGQDNEAKLRANLAEYFRSRGHRDRMALDRPARARAQVRAREPAVSVNLRRPHPPAHP